MINYAKQDFVTEIKTRTDGRAVDLVLEMVGGKTFHENLEAVAPYGQIVVYGYASDNKKAVVDNIEMIWGHPVNIAWSCRCPRWAGIQSRGSKRLLTR